MKNKSASHSALIVLFTVLAFGVYSSPARAQASTNWRVTTGDWFTDANWSNHVPTLLTDAFINDAGKAQINGPGANAKSLTLGLNQGDSGSVTVDGTNPNDGSLSVPDDCTDQFGIFPGLISVGYSGTGALLITNGGTVASRWGDIAATANTQPPNSNGSVTVSGAGSTWIISSSCGNPAKLFIGGSETENGDDPGGTALLNVTNGGEVIVDNQTNQASIHVGPSGTLAGNGNIKTVYHAPDGLDTVVAVSGTLAPSGTLSIDGDLFLNGIATTLCSVIPTAADMVEVSRTGNLGGRLSVIMTGTFPGDTTRYTLLHADGGLPNNTTFQSVSIKYPTNQGFTPHITYDYVANSVYLDLVFNE